MIPFHIPIVKNTISRLTTVMHQIFNLNKKLNHEIFLSLKKMRLWALLGPFSDRKDRFPYPFIYQKPEKGTPLGRQCPAPGRTPRVTRNRSYLLLIL